jgi:CPA1 family monovalent cation:H+ antiporter
VAACTHLEHLPVEVTPSTQEGCEDCLREGTTWVQLRTCLSCGHVACCNSSPQRHALLHHQSTEHPVMASFEPGETWRWCYVDQTLV